VSASKEERWAAVYGAYVALQVHQMMVEGRGAPGQEPYGGFVEDAECVADQAEEAWAKFKGEGAIG
jgi:hypothetical protein